MELFFSLRFFCLNMDAEHEEESDDKDGDEDGDAAENSENGDAWHDRDPSIVVATHTNTCSVAVGQSLLETHHRRA